MNEPCPVCADKRYVICHRAADGRAAVERCDSCSCFDWDREWTKFSGYLSDADAAALARADGVNCRSAYPCYVIPS